jgi:DNA-binding transcriptional ArsR family regulator
MDDSNLLPIWNALAEAKRRQILELLEERPRTTGELCEFFDVSRYAVMKHLKVLEEAGLIVVKREGRKRWNIRNDRSIDLLQGRAAANNDGTTKPSTIFDLFPVATQTLFNLEPTGATSIDQDTLLKATPEAVFTALTGHIDAWWRWRSPGTLGVYLEPTVGGRFYQAFSEAGDGELLAWVTYIKCYEEIRLNGPMGLADAAAVNAIRLQLEPYEKGTRLRLHHRLTGRRPMPRPSAPFDCS